MNKFNTQEWVGTLEVAIDKKLKKWMRGHKIQNGEAIHLNWQFEQSHILLYIFWEDHKESVHFQCSGPRANYRFEWTGLSDKTFNKVIDRVGNLAQIIMHPPIDPSLIRE